METDGTLIEPARAGPPDAFVEVVRRHELAVHGFLARRAGPRSPTTCSVRSGPARSPACTVSIPPHQNARPWLYGIARNVLRAHWRGRTAEQTAAMQAAPKPAAQPNKPPTRGTTSSTAWTRPRRPGP